MIKYEKKEYFTAGSVVRKDSFTSDAGYVKSSETVKGWPSWKKEIVGTVIKKFESK